MNCSTFVHVMEHFLFRSDSACRSRCSAGETGWEPASESGAARYPAQDKAMEHFAREVAKSWPQREAWHARCDGEERGRVSPERNGATNGIPLGRFDNTADH